MTLALTTPRDEAALVQVFADAAVNAVHHGRAAARRHDSR